MSIYVCGDTHFPHDGWKLTNRHWPEQRQLNKNDYLIILGDFGMIWNAIPDKEELYIKKELSKRKFTTLFLDGNHENFDRLEQLPEIDMLGGKVGVYTDSIYHLKRGYVYDICGKKIFTFGGAMSTDKVYRTFGVSWWKQETQTKEEEDFAYDNLEKVDFKVDHVLTHAAPKSIVSQFTFIDPERHNDPVARFLDILRCRVEFDSWHFGHYHKDLVIEDKFHLHYNEEPYLLVEG